MKLEVDLNWFLYTRKRREWLKEKNKRCFFIAFHLFQCSFHCLDDLQGSSLISTFKEMGNRPSWRWNSELWMTYFTQGAEMARDIRSERGHRVRIEILGEWAHSQIYFLEKVWIKICLRNEKMRTRMFHEKKKIKQKQF